MSKQESSRLKELVLAGMVSGIGYALAAVYYVGFFQHFRLPLGWIRVSLSDVLVFGVVFIMSAIPILLLINVFLSVIDPKTNFGQACVRAVLMPCVLGVLWWYNGLLLEQKGWIWLISILAMNLLLEFALPIIPSSDTKGKSYWERVEIFASRSGDWGTNEDLVSRARRVLGLQGYRLAALLVYASILAYSFGQGSALRQNEYWTLAGTNLAVMNVSDDRVILAEFDPQAKEVTSRLVIATAKPGEKPIEFVRQAIGPLKAPKK